MPSETCHVHPHARINQIERGVRTAGDEIKSGNVVQLASALESVGLGDSEPANGAEAPGTRGKTLDEIKAVLRTRQSRTLSFVIIGKSRPGSPSRLTEYRPR